jgi:hypothetical protein
MALNRVPLRPGIASILVPNQSAVMLWETLRSTAIGLSIALVQSFRRLKAHNQQPAGVGTEKIEPSFKKGVLTVTLPKKSAGAEVREKARDQGYCLVDR